MTDLYIYVLIDPRDDRIRYVGKTDSIERRLSEHIYDGKHNKKKTAKSNWIEEILKEGMTPRLEVLETVKPREWKERERYWIQFFRKTIPDLNNMTDGGDGLDFSESHFAKLVSKKAQQTRKETKLWRYELGRTSSKWMGVTKTKGSSLFRTTATGFRWTRNSFFQYETEAALMYNKYAMEKYGKYGVLNFVTEEDILAEKEKRLQMEEEYYQQVLVKFRNNERWKRQISRNEPEDETSQELDCGS